jgi:hypothetical protein
MKKRKFIYILSALLLLNSCELIEPNDSENPNLDIDNFLNSTSTMAPWRNGLQKDFALAIGSFTELTELVSDNYFNDYTLSSKVFDIPRIDYQDTDVKNLQLYVAQLREAANLGLGTIALRDAKTTETDKFVLNFIKGYSFLLAGEYFTGLPMEKEGEVKDWKANLNEAITIFKSLQTGISSIPVTAASSKLPVDNRDVEDATLNLLIARAYYRLGDSQNALTYARNSLTANQSFVKYVYFDGANSIANSAQTYIYANSRFEPLPRLDFLDPKYFQLSSTDQRPIAIAKAEEAHLIIAESQISSGLLNDAAGTMKQLITLVKSRPVQTVNDGTEVRGSGFPVEYPNSSDYTVASSQGKEYRSGLVLTRNSVNKNVTVPYVSGTSVTNEMVDAALNAGQDDMLKLLYLMRQEILFAEGRRICDLGIRFPVSFQEFSVNPSAEGFTIAQIPSFIPLNQEMDSFTMDKTNKRVTIKWDMNEVIVSNKRTEYVVPFIN